MGFTDPLSGTLKISDLFRWSEYDAPHGASRPNFTPRYRNRVCRASHPGSRRFRVQRSVSQASADGIDGQAMNNAIADAFPGGSVSVSNTGAYFQVRMRQHGLLRPLLASELSDGTLRYLQLIAALLSPRPPALMILNEPETSLHPDLLPSLAQLIVQASRQCQMIVVSHAATLVTALNADADSSCWKRPWANRRSRIMCRRTGRGPRDSASTRARMALRPLSASLSRPGLRAARWRSRPQTLSRRPRGATEWHQRGPSGRRD